MVVATHCSRALAAAAVAMAAMVAAPGVAADPPRHCALVIGNGAYHGSHMGRLKHAPTDARAVADALRRLGFSVQESIDAGTAEIHAALDRFRAAARAADLALVYYSGHGLEVSGRSYFVPADWPGRSCGEVDLPDVSAQGLLDDLKADGVPHRIVIVDACRIARTCARSRAPLPPFRQRALADGELLFFATGPREEAQDSPDFRKALVKAMEARPNADVREVFEDVRRAVAHRGRQEPQLESALDAPLGTVTLAGESPRRPVD